MAGQPGLFDLDERYTALSRTGDPLERLAAVVDFEVFRADPDAAPARSDRTKGGRPPIDPVMLFKVLILQALSGLADERTGFQVRDRLSFTGTGCRSCAFSGSSSMAGRLTRRRSSGPTPTAESTAASRTIPPWRIFS